MIDEALPDFLGLCEQLQEELSRTLLDHSSKKATTTSEAIKNRVAVQKFKLGLRQAAETFRQQTKEASQTRIDEFEAQLDRANVRNQTAEEERRESEHMLDKTWEEIKMLKSRVQGQEKVITELRSQCQVLEEKLVVQSRDKDNAATNAPSQSQSETKRGELLVVKMNVNAEIPQKRIDLMEIENETLRESVCMKEGGDDDASVAMHDFDWVTLTLLET